jgi:DNA-binding PadR family transcriptional regulator
MSKENQIPTPSRLVHEPARLSILTVLSSCASADFVFLQGAAGLSKGNLSAQLSNLAEAGLINVSREIVDKKTRTTVWLSERGVAEMKDYWQVMDEIRAHSSTRETRLANRDRRRANLQIQSQRA